ncbi:MAG: phenylacetate--CoA ligase family protein [Candidatus Aminicenantes bacterium]|nr:phenylacetate--CoA ligase family protein [Candidatus Aminicenantes bacterium]
MTTYNYRLKLYDLLKKTKTKHYFDFFLSTLDWNKKELYAYRLAKLRELVAYARTHCAYYRDIFDKNNIAPGSICSLEDLKRIPVLTRQDIRENLSSLLSSEKDRLTCFKSSSSGTTGIPITYYQDGDGHGAGIAAGYLSCYLSGWRFGHRSLHIWGNRSSVKNWSTPGSRLKQKLFRQKKLAATILNDEKNYPQVIDLINRFKPYSIDGYTSSIYSLARYLRENQVDIHKPGIVFTTAENLFPYQREIIEQELAKVSDIYGCGEINGIAVQPLDSARYYIIEPHVIVETEKTGTDPGLHEIIVTDLDNRVLPFIRYKIGDLIDEIRLNDGTGPVKYDYFSRVRGRAVDTIDLGSGKKLFPINIVGGTAFRKIPGIVKHRVTWDGQCLHFIFETNEHFNLPTAEQTIREILVEYDYNVKTGIEPVKKLLPGDNGKFTYFENKQSKGVEPAP